MTSSKDRVDDDEDDVDGDIVIVSRPKLNLPPVQYSKQYYDLNMNGLEIELRRLSPSVSPAANIASVTKSPFKTTVKAISNASTAAVNPASASGTGTPSELRRNKQLNQIRQRFHSL